jgi:ABC-type glucose/galactose transport system permease subunit
LLAGGFLFRAGRVDRMVEGVVAVDAVHRCVSAGTSLSAPVGRARVLLGGVIFLSADSTDSFHLAYSSGVPQLVAFATLRGRPIWVVGGKSAGSVAYCEGGSSERF